MSLLAAVKNNDLKKLNECIERGEDPSNNDNEALRMAIESRCMDIIDRLLQEPCVMKNIQAKGDFALSLTCKYGHEKLVIARKILDVYIAHNKTIPSFATDNKTLKDYIASKKQGGKLKGALIARLRMASIALPQKLKITLKRAAEAGNMKALDIFKATLLSEENSRALVCSTKDGHSVFVSRLLHCPTVIAYIDALDHQALPAAIAREHWDIVAELLCVYITQNLSNFMIENARSIEDLILHMKERALSIIKKLIHNNHGISFENNIVLPWLIGNHIEIAYSLLNHLPIAGQVEHNNAALHCAIGEKSLKLVNLLVTCPYVKENIAVMNNRALKLAISLPEKQRPNSPDHQNTLYIIDILLKVYIEQGISLVNHVDILSCLTMLDKQINLELSIFKKLIQIDNDMDIFFWSLENVCGEKVAMYLLNTVGVQAQAHIKNNYGLYLAVKNEASQEVLAPLLRNPLVRADIGAADHRILRTLAKNSDRVSIGKKVIDIYFENEIFKNKMAIPKFVTENRALSEYVDLRFVLLRSSETGDLKNLMCSINHQHNDDLIKQYGMNAFKSAIVGKHLNVVCYLLRFDAIRLHLHDNNHEILHLVLAGGDDNIKMGEKILKIYFSANIFIPTFVTHNKKLASFIESYNRSKESLNKRICELEDTKSFIESINQDIRCLEGQDAIYYQNMLNYLETYKSQLSFKPDQCGAVYDAQEAIKENTRKVKEGYLPAILFDSKVKAEKKYSELDLIRGVFVEQVVVLYRGANFLGYSINLTEEAVLTLAKNGDIDFLIQLKSNKIPIVYNPKYLELMLSTAVKHGHMEFIQYLVLIPEVLRYLRDMECFSKSDSSKINPFKIFDEVVKAGKPEILEPLVQFEDSGFVAGETLNALLDVKQRSKFYSVLEFYYTQHQKLPATLSDQAKATLKELSEARVVRLDEVLSPLLPTAIKTLCLQYDATRKIAVYDYDRTSEMTRKAFSSD